MHEMFANLLGYLQNATRYKWLALILAWVICIGGWGYVSKMPDVYKAEARVHVDTRSVLRPLLRGLTVEPDLGAQVALMAKLLFGRPNLEKVARMTDLDLGAKDEKAMDALVKRLQASMSIGGGVDRIFTISASDPDPKIAKKIVQSVLTLFVEQTLGDSREDSDTAHKFLDQQVKEYEERLLAAEQARENYKRSNYGLLPGQGGDPYNQLTTLSAQLEESKMAVQEAIDRRNEIERQLQNEEPLFTDFGGTDSANAAISPIDQRIQALQGKLDEMLFRYTKNHPDVIALKKSIQDIEGQKKRQQEEEAKKAASTSNQETSGKEANPIFQQTKIALGDADANVASLTSRVKIYEEKIDKLKREMDDRLKVETQLQGLNRDYAAIKANYDGLLERREKAKLSESVEQNTDSVKFRVLDPPQAPSKPDAPNRILLSSIIMVASIVLGLAIAVLLALLRPTFNTSQKVREITGYPVLGSVSMNWIPSIRIRKRREFVQFTFWLSSLFAVFVAVVLLEIRGINLRNVFH
jgi:polysaccharide chain length determinant protein (PEP-CTERM system associated)